MSAQSLAGGIPHGYTVEYVTKASTVGRNIAAVRDERHWTQTELADKLRVRQPSVAKVEKAKGLPHVKTVLKYAKALECSAERLLQNVDPAYEAVRVRRAVSEQWPTLDAEDADTIAQFLLLPPDRRAYHRKLMLRFFARQRRKAENPTPAAHPDSQTAPKTDAGRKASGGENAQ